MAKIAVVAAKGLGDGLLSLVLSHNLLKSGHEVTTFNPLLPQLQRWFDEKKLAPFPKPENFQDIFSQFDEIIAFDHSILNESHSFGNTLHLLKQRDFDKRKSFVDNVIELCEHKFHLPFCDAYNGICPPRELVFKRFPRRVAIHTMSSCTTKNWPKEKFIKLGRKLHSLGFEAAIILSPHERKQWLDLEHDKQIALPLFPTLDDTACYIYESGFLIGNDSGLGHLASNMDLPTLSLFARKSYARLWRPGWGNNRVVTPLPLLIGAPLKARFWKEALPVKRVLNTFQELI
jgi:heptosyltransferase-3